MDNVKVCAVCGKQFGPRPGERPVMFASRKRCGFYCRPVTNPDKTGRGRAAAMYPGQPCEVCGMPYGGRGRVQRHHRDSDRLNNSRENIAFLCVKHHKEAHQESDGMVGGGPRPRVTRLMHDRAVVLSHEARRLRADGLTVDEVAARLRVHRASVLRWFRKYPDAA